MCENTSNPHFNNVAGTYAAIYHQLYSNLNESQLPGTMQPSENNETMQIFLPPMQSSSIIPAQYNVQPMPESLVNYQQATAAFNTVHNPSAAAEGHQLHVDRSVQLATGKQQPLSKFDSDSKFLCTEIQNTSTCQKQANHNNMTITSDSSRLLNNTVNTKLRSCEKLHFANTNTLKQDQNLVFADEAAALKSYEEWLGNKPTDMSTKRVFSGGEVVNIGNQSMLSPHVISVTPVNTNTNQHVISVTPVNTNTNQQAKTKQKKLKYKKGKGDRIESKVKYVSAGQTNISGIRAQKYEKLNEIKDKFYKSCHVCFNDPHFEVTGCPLMTPNAIVQNNENNTHGFGLPEPLLLGLSKYYKTHNSIFARDVIPAYTRFGPLKGRKINFQEQSKISLNDIDCKHFWPINASDDDELELEGFIDSQHVSESNWMRFLKPEPPLNTTSYNIQRVTLDEEIYFISTKVIQPGEEIFFRAIEPPFRVYYNLQHLQQVSTLCNAHSCKRKKTTFAFDLENIVYLIRHIYLNHTAKFGTCKVASIYNCNLCKDDFFDMSNFQNHVKEKHADSCEEPVSHTCNICKNTFSSKIAMKKHFKTVHLSTIDGESTTCPICKESFVNKTKLLSHVKDAHLNEPVLCQSCGKGFKSKSVMENHVKKIHEHKYWKECSLCNKGFKDLYQLRQHMLTHTGAKPFRCIVKRCPAQFTTKQWLQKHYISGHGFTAKNMPVIKRHDALKANNPSNALLLFKPRPKKKATYVPPAKPGTSLRIPEDFNLSNALRPLGKLPPTGKNVLAKNFFFQREKKDIKNEKNGSLQAGLESDTVLTGDKNV